MVPSRAESLPYIVLEAGAAGLPQIVTDVGGIGEIFGADSAELIPPANTPALVQALEQALDQPEYMAQLTMRLQRRIEEHFSLQSLGQGVMSAYDAAMPAARSIALP